jgi:hypothetical protein
VAAPQREPLSRRSRTLLGGALGGILGTSGIILLGLGIEGAFGFGLDRLIPELELGFGGPLAGAGVLGPDFSVPIHYLHGAILGLVLAGLLLLDDRLRWADRIPVWADGLIFGAVVASVVLVLLDATSGSALTPGLAGLVILLHVTFGGLAGAVVQRVRETVPRAAREIPAP